MEFGNLTALLNGVKAMNTQQIMALSLIHILGIAFRGEDYRSILFVGNTSHHRYKQYDNFDINLVLKELIQIGDIPVVIIDDKEIQKEGLDLSMNSYNRRILVLVNLMESSFDFQGDSKLLRKLWHILGRNTKVRLILLVKNAEDTYVMNLLKFCSLSKYVNVIALRLNTNATLEYTDSFYTIKLFPQEEVIRKKLTANLTELFPLPVQNMHGSKIRLIVDQVAPKTYIYYSKSGAATLSGYVGKLFVEFARKHNASLTFPFLEGLGAFLYTDIMDAMLENGTYDMSTALTFDYRPSSLIRTNNYDFMDWCIMLPVEKPVPSYILYVIIFDSTTLALILLALVAMSCILTLSTADHGQLVCPGEYVFNVHAFNAFLGQPFKTHARVKGLQRALYLLAAFSGIIFSTTYNSYLQSLKAHSPREAPVCNLDQLAKSGKKLAVYRGEMSTMCRTAPDCEKYRSFVYEISNYSDYFALRDSFDVRFAFPVPSAKWISYEMQQKFLSRPVFRLSNICFIRAASNLFSLPVNSVYLEPLNRLIGQLHQAGLVQYWKLASFLEQVKLGHVRITHLAFQDEFIPLHVGDMYPILLLFIVAISGTISVFIMELSIGKFLIFWKVTKKKLRRRCRVSES